MPSSTPAASLRSVPSLQSPEMSSEGGVVLRLCAPAAADVRVIGDWKSKSPAGDSLTKDEQGIWSISIGPMKPDLYEYWFIVDGVKTIDPSNVHSSNAIRAHVDLD